jgi:hypothetical protein
MKRSSLGRAAVLLALLAAIAIAAPAAQAVAPAVVQCGQVITQNTKLAADVTGCAQNGVVIGADNITLDLNGHAISGDESATNEEAGVFNPGFDNVTITHGTITGFPLVINAGEGGGSSGLVIRGVTGTGIFGDLFVVGNGVLIEKNTLLGNNDAAIVYAGNDSVITKNLIVGNNDIAIFVTGDRNQITKNTIRSGPNCGAFVDAEGQDNVVQKNETSATGGECVAG